MKLSRFSEMQIIHSDNVYLAHASLLAGAIGDSLGAAIEFDSLSVIRSRFPKGIVDLPPYEGMVGAITDDTQMSLFTAEGIIRANIARRRGSQHTTVQLVYEALLRWYVTQGEQPSLATDQIGLINDQRLHHARAPGMTIMESLGDVKSIGGRLTTKAKVVEPS